MREDVLARLRGRRIHVIGFSGTEGAAVIQFLLDGGIGSITAHDLVTSEEFPAAFRRYHGWMTPAAQEAAIARLLTAPIQRRFRERYLEDIARAEVIYAGQAWFRHPENAPVALARDTGAYLSSMTELFFQTVSCPILGVTGTNGKFTVASLATDMLTASGRPTFVSGNDRTHVPILYRLNEITSEAILVLEISNRQLVGLRYSPQIAVITNLAPHHLDDHGSFAGYVRVKAGLLAHQKPGDWAILNADDPTTWDLAASCRGAVLPFSRLRRVPEGACLVDDEITVRLDGREDRLCPAAAFRAPGAHALENALAAALAARRAGASPAAAAAVLRAFRGLPYRMRLAAEIDGVRYYEDSLATNPAAAAAAIRAFDRPLVLIAGGQRHSAGPEDFGPMALALGEKVVRAVLLIGAMAPHIAAAVAAFRISAPVVQCGTLEDAVLRARAIAKPGDVITLSPGCESFDQFRDYRERGDRFLELVSALAGGAGARAVRDARWS